MALKKWVAVEEIFEGGDVEGEGEGAEEDVGGEGGDFSAIPKSWVFMVKCTRQMVVVGL